MNKQNVLIVDDEINIIKALRRLFAGHSFRVFTAGSAAEARRILNETDIDLVLSDYKMPEETGYELLAYVRDAFPGIIRIMLSGYVEKQVILETLFSCAAVTCFPKPWDDDRLVKRVTELLELKREAGASRFWGVLNSGRMFRINGRILDRLRSMNPGDTGSADIEKIISRDLFLYLHLFHVVNSDYFDEEPVYELGPVLKTIGTGSFLELIRNIPEDLVVRDGFFLYAPELLIKYYPRVYRALNGREFSGKREIPAVFIYILRYIFSRTNPEEYKKQAEEFASTGRAVEIPDTVKEAFRAFSGIYRFFVQFAEYVESIAVGESPEAETDRYLSCLLEFLWWGGEMSENSFPVRIPEDEISVMYDEIISIQQSRPL